MNPLFPAALFLALVLAAPAPAFARGAAALPEAGRILEEVFPGQAAALDAILAGGEPADAAGTPLDSRPVVTQAELDEKLRAEVRRGNVVDVGRLLLRGADAGAKDERGVTVLMVAAERGFLRQDYLDVARLLLDRGAPVSSFDDAGETALHRAVRPLGNREMVELLGKARGVRLDAKDEDGETPLLSAVGLGNAETVLALVKLGADKELAGGFHVPRRDLYGNQHLDLKEFTPLMAAAWMGVPKVLEALLGAKPDLRRRDQDGATALGIAVARGNDAAIKLLVAAGAEG